MGNDDEVKRLASWLAERRWYGEKTRTLTGAETIFHADVNVGPATIHLDIHRLSFASGQPADYLLITDPAMPEADGVESEVVRKWLVDSFVEGRSVVGSGGRTLTF
ncbi:MAG TPA: hypothetical protein VGR08_07535, partial [Thermomicrobiales bacterium]|nr:hypothetical protein [Thermomicrobiales bacterium]